MGLIVPDVSSTTGPTYATQVNTSLNTIDSHNHTSGQGNQVPASGLNINADLSFGGFNATSLRSSRYSAQSTVLSLGTDLGCVYVVGVDLYYNDVNGNNVRITQNGSLAAANGSISNLTAPASAAYVSVSGTFVWQSDTNVAANLDARNVILRNSTASSNGLTLSPPAAMGSNYTITFPSVPGSQSFMTIDASGNIAAPITYANGITASNIANATITTAKIASGTIALSNINSSSAFPSIVYQEITANGNFVVPNTTSILAVVVGGGGGGAGGAAGGAGRGGGGGGSGSNPILVNLLVTPGETLGINIGSAGAAGAGGAGGNVGTQSYIARGATKIAISGPGSGGSAGSGTSGGAGASSTYNGSTLSVGGGAGGGSGASGSGGSDGFYGVAGGGGVAGAGHGGGGGGGAGLGAGGDGGVGNANAGNASNYGAGGGGGGGSATGGNGGNGGAGYVRISWVQWG